MNKYIDNLEAKKVISLKDLVLNKENNLNVFSLVERNSLMIKILSLGKDAEVPTHSGTGDTIVNAIEGEGYITIDNEIFELKSGESILIPANSPHSLKTKENENVFDSNIYSPACICKIKNRIRSKNLISFMRFVY